MDENDDDRINDQQGAIDKKIVKLATEYRNSEIRSKDESDRRAEIRETIEKLGFHSKAFQDEVRSLKAYSPGERSDYDSSRQRMRSILEPELPNLFADDVKRNEKREERRREAEAKAKAAAPADNPRSDPKRGGAGGANGKKRAADAKPKPPRREKGPKGSGPAAATRAAAAASDSAVADAIAKQEQSDGDATLEAGMPLSQSAQAAAVRNKLGLN